MSATSQAVSSFPTLAAELIPGRSLVRNAMLALVFSALTGLAAQVSIPLAWTPVPITGQTFAVLLTGAVLGWRLGFLSMALYLAEGAAGLPVFAGGAGGWIVFAGASGGYLLSYPFAAALVGWCTARGWDRRPLGMGLAMLAGSAVIYGVGVPWLGIWLIGAGQPAGLGGLLGMGMFPFLPGDTLKALLAMAILPAAWKWAGKRA